VLQKYESWGNLDPSGVIKNKMDVKQISKTRCFSICFNSIKIAQVVKINAIFDDSVRSEKLPLGLNIYPFEKEYFEGVVKLKSFRDLKTKQVLEDENERELKAVNKKSGYHVFVALIENQVVGLCRVAQYSKVEKNKFDSPEGWWFQGVIIHPDFRRKNIAKMLTDYRFDFLRKRNIKEVYSAVEVNNSVSKRMHQRFGFKLIGESKGKFNNSFHDGRGFILRSPCISKRGS